MMRGSWWGQWFGGPGPGTGEALHLLLTRIWRMETALACHLAERARAVRFAPHRLRLEGMAERESQNAHAQGRETGGGITLAATDSPVRRTACPAMGGDIVRPRLPKSGTALQGGRV